MTLKSKQKISRRYYPRRIRYDMYRVYCNAKTATYSLYALGTTVPRQTEDFQEIVNILHTLVGYKRDKLPARLGGAHHA